jgi:uncharacterized protein (DUF1800 family)
VAGVAILPSALGNRKDKYAKLSEMDESKRASHLLNRLSFGARPGDVERVMTTGVDSWIDQQLHPARLDDSVLEDRLAPFLTLGMSTEEMVRKFPPRKLVQAVADGKLALPSDPMERAVYEDQLQALEQKREQKTEASKALAAGQAQPDSDLKPVSAAGAEMERERNSNRTGSFADLSPLSPDLRLQTLLAMSAADRGDYFHSLKGDQRDKLLAGMSPRQREITLALNNPNQVVTDELLQGKLLRATYSERQLEEVMTDFWFNHFNVFIGKEDDRFLLTSYERDVIRPRALGKFEDLLIATAESPSMLYYLDNWLSVGPNSDVANGIKGSDRRAQNRRAHQSGPVKGSKGKRNGLNENYGRELMELHTLGVNGGYTQKDVTEVARVLTGWTLEKPKNGGGYSFRFEFDPRMHEPGDKMVLGHRIKPNGEKEGLEVLHILAHHPATARFIATKLAMRFVSDAPPPSLIDRMTRTFLKKDGEIGEVLKTMLSSPEFWSPDAYRAKVKTPLEFEVSALRASGAQIADAMPLVRQLQNMGMPLYGMQPPTGYSMQASTWVNSGALLERMNFALALTSGKLRGVSIQPNLLLGGDAPPGDAEQTLAILEGSLLAGDLSKQTHDSIARQLQEPAVKPKKLNDGAPAVNVGVIAGLLLGSPEFQRR